MAYGLTQSADLERSSSQYFSAADSASLSITGNLTVEAWIKLESLPASGEEYDIISKHDNGATGNGRSWITGYQNSGGTLQFIWRNSSNGTSGAQSVATWNSTLSTGVWYHVAFAYSTAGTVICYLNGSSLGSVGSQQTSIFDSSTRVTVGARDNGGGTGASFLDGRMSLARVWNTTRSAADILANICNVYGTATTNMQAEWSLNNVLTDASGNSNTLTNNNTVTFGVDTPSVCAVAGPATVKTWDGVTQSTAIKTYFGVDLANVKTVDGAS